MNWALRYTIKIQMKKEKEIKKVKACNHAWGYAPRKQ